ncbi:virion core protein, T7 gp14 family [Rhizobium leguminosarum]
MCEPSLLVGALSFAVSGVKAVAEYQAQNQEAKANEKASVQTWKDQQTQISQREMQEQDALRQKQTQQNIEEAQAKAEVAVSGAAAGVSGISLDNLLQDVGRRAETNRQVEQTNTDMVFSQLRLQRKGINSEAQSRINSVPRASPLTLIAGLGSAGVSGYNSYISAKNRLMED